MRRPSAFFLLNLIQDVNIVRPLVLLAANEMKLDVGLLVSLKLRQSDATGRWMQDIKELAEQCAIDTYHFSSTFEALQALSGRSGILVAASESNLPAHVETHEVFRSAPPGFLTLTLQHGFEGVGFLQSREHDLVHGRGVTFAADIVCGWFDISRQTSLLPSQRSKLFVTGPGCLLNPPVAAYRRSDVGIICENLHSIRFTANTGTQGDFVQYFQDFCRDIERDRRRVVLRPHPAGQFSVKSQLKLPPNASLNNEPMYKIPLSNYAYGISAASSVIIDMVLADIPVAVWRDDTGVMDASAFDGLTVVRTAQDWVDFSRQAIAVPEVFIERQREFLDRQKMIYEPNEVRRRFVSVFGAAAAAAPLQTRGPRASHRILLGYRQANPAMESFFRSPFEDLSAVAELSLHSLPMATIKKSFGIRMSPDAIAVWVETKLAAIDPTVIVVPEGDLPSVEVATLVQSARRKDIPVVVLLGASGGVANAKAEAALLARLTKMAVVVCGPPARLARLRPALEKRGIASCEFTATESHRVVPVSRSGYDERVRSAQQIRRMCALAAKPPNEAEIAQVA
jgi:hypothetical protein